MNWNTLHGRANLGLLVGVLGALLFGEGVLLFVSSNWRVIPDSIKVVMIFANLVASYWLAYRMKFASQPKPGLASGLFLKGAIGYGAGVFLVAQIYNFHADWRSGLLYWFVGTLPLAYVVKSRPVLVLSLGTLLFWMISEFGFFGPPVLILLPLVGATFVLLAVLHWQHQHTFAGTYFMTGACLLLITTLFLAWDNVVSYQLDSQSTAKFWVHFWTLTGAYAILLLTTLMGARASTDRGLRWLAVFLSAALGPAFYLAAGIPRESSVGSAFLLSTNLLLFAECLGLLFFGVARNATPPVKLGLTFAGLLMLWRFFDEYWYYLSRSVVFLLVGVSMLAWAYWWERTRQKRDLEVQS